MRNRPITLAATVGFWLSLAAIGFVTLSPIELRPEVAGLQTEHFLAFAVVGFLAAIAYPRRVLPVLVLVIGCAAVLELAQHLVPGRHGRLIDFAVKACGAVAGFALATLGGMGLRFVGRSRVT